MQLSTSLTAVLLGLLTTGFAAADVPSSALPSGFYTRPEPVPARAATSAAAPAAAGATNQPKGHVLHAPANGQQTAVSSSASASPQRLFVAEPSASSYSAARVARPSKHGNAATSTGSSSSSATSSSSASAANPSATGGYGTSPPFYPSPPAAGTGDWATAVAKAKAWLQSWTIEEKAGLATGVGWQRGRCVGNIASNSRGFPGLCLEDSPLGVRFADLVTVFPAGITVASTFDRSLIEKRGVAMGQEFRGKGVNVQLGPMMNIGRVAAGGRNWEGFGADPYLSGEAAFYTVQGIQSAGVQATAKHYINNEQEHYRTAESSNVDARTQREIYVHPFLRSVQAGVASVMCSYNQENNSYACQNSEMLNRVLKTELGFQGYVMSDWGATMSGVASVNAGLDMTMPGDVYCCYLQNGSYFGGNLTQAVQNGSVSEARLDDMATRILAAWYKLGQDQNYPSVNFNAFNATDPATNEHVNVQADHAQVVRAIDVAGTVLLKNKNKALPLGKPNRVALIGSDAGPSPDGPNYFADRGGDEGVLGEGWGSGTADYSYLISPYEAIQSHVQAEGTEVSWYFDDWNLSGAQQAAANADVAIVFVNSDSGEGYITVDGNAGDRNNLTAWNNGDNLVNAVASANKNTIVVVHSVGPLIVEPWIDNSNVSAVLWANLQGEDSGNALVDILYGNVSPSGRLPYTIAKQRSDYPADVIYESSETSPQIYYNEGLLVDYRWFDAKNMTPRFEFGYGLSYSSFKYSNLKVTPKGSWTKATAAQTMNAKWGGATVGNGLPSWLFDVAYQITFSVRNVGGVDANEVGQLYIGFPASSGEPPKVLKGFDRKLIKVGSSATFTLNLTYYDVSVYDAASARWIRPEGDYEVYIGASSRDIRLTGPLDK